MTTFEAVAFVVAVAFACGLVLGGAVGFTLSPRTRCAPNTKEDQCS